MTKVPGASWTRGCERWQVSSMENSAMGLRTMAPTVRGVSMQLFYVDECGDTGMNFDPPSKANKRKGLPSPWFVLTAVGVRDTSRRPLAEAITEIKTRYFGARHHDVPWGRTELKGRFLAQAYRSYGSSTRMPGGPWHEAFPTPDRFDALLQDLGRLFMRFRPMVFSVAVDKKRALETGLGLHPIGICYAFLHVRAAQVLSDVIEGEGAIFIADQQIEHENYFRSGELNRDRDAITKDLPAVPAFEAILDKPLWVDTELSTWDREIIQLADIAAYTTYEWVKKPGRPEEPHYLWEYIEPSVPRNWASGTTEGAGLTIYPLGATYPET